MKKVYIMGALFLFLVTLELFIPIAFTQYPWGPSTSKEYPWVDYLASLTSERNVKQL